MSLPHPNLLLIGVQRGGTTWVWEQLRQHPQIFMARRKEVEFFSYRSNLNQRCWGGYLKYFRGAEDAIYRGEATPSYFLSTDRSSPWHCEIPDFNEDIPGSVRRYLGTEARFILCLRDPVERAVSAYFHHARHGRIVPHQSIIEAGHTGRIIDAGFYARHLAAWLEHFSRDQFFVTTTEAIAADPEGVLLNMQTFLGADLSPFSQATSKVNHGRRRGHFLGGIRRLRSLGTGPVVKPQELDQLAEIYAPDQARLREMLGYDPFESISSSSQPVATPDQSAQ